MKQPKEIAEELIDSNYKQLKWGLLSHSHEFILDNAKKCALICCDEILNLNVCFTGKGSPAEKDFGEDSTIEFWQAVKKELK